MNTISFFFYPLTVSQGLTERLLSHQRGCREQKAGTGGQWKAERNYRYCLNMLKNILWRAWFLRMNNIRKYSMLVCFLTEKRWRSYLSNTFKLFKDKEWKQTISSIFLRCQIKHPHMLILLRHKFFSVASLYAMPTGFWMGLNSPYASERYQNILQTG